MEEQVKEKKQSVQLVLKETNLHFEADKLMSVNFQAQCEGFEDLKNIQYDWSLCRNGIEKCSKTTFQGTTIVGIHSMYAGDKFCMKLMVSANRKAYLPPGNMRINPKPDANTVVLTAEKEFIPVCDKKLLSIEWCNMNSNPFYRRRLNGSEKSDFPSKVFHLNGSDFAIVYAYAELAGYNGTEVTVYRDAFKQDDTSAGIIRETEILRVRNGGVGVSFSRNVLRMDMKPSDVREVTLAFRIQEPAHSGRIIADFRCKVKVYGMDKVEELTSFPPQPVVVGNTNIVENNYNPCKYTEIDVAYVIDQKSKETKTIKVYNEARSIKALPVYITGGKRKTVITLLNYTPERCGLYTDIHKKRRTISLPDRPVLPDLSIKDGKIELDLQYDYGFSEGDKIDFTKIFQYFCLPADKVQKHLVQVATCRHSHELCLNMIPDIKWKFYAGFGMSYPEYSRKPDYSLLRAEPYPRKKSIREQEKEAAEARDSQIGGIKYVLGMEIEFNDGANIDLGGSIVHKVENATQTIRKVMKFLRLDNFFKFKDDEVQRDLKAKEETDRQVIQYAGRNPNSSKFKPFEFPCPLFMDIGAPTLFVGGTWQYDDSYGDDLCRKGSVFVEANPLIDVKGGIDLIALSMYIPVAGEVIAAIIKGEAALERAITIASSGKIETEMDLWLNVYLKGSIQFRGELGFSSGSTSVVLETEATVILGVEFGIKCGISTKTVTFRSGKKREVVISGELGVEANLHTGFTITPTATYDSESGMAVDVTVGFDGVVLEYSGKAEVKKTENKGKEVSIRKGKSKKEVEGEEWSYGDDLSGKSTLIDTDVIPPWTWHFDFPKHSS